MNNIKDLKYWIWFSKIKRLGSINSQRLLNKYNNPKEIWKLKQEDLIKCIGPNEKIINDILNEKYRNDYELNKTIKYMLNHEIELINIYDKDYPKKLNYIYDKPISLYIKGNKKLLNSFSLAIIGCRNNSNYGKFVAEVISSNLAKRNIATISGLAKGIDSIAHKSTVNEKGKTIAVIGSGLDIIYPSENIGLVDEIIKNNGIIISEYCIGEKPEKMHFPARNRIISGMSDGIIVVEAKKKSGTMITVDFALEQGKNVFTVPGNIINENSEGTNELIKQGAIVVTNINDILQEY